MSVNYNNKMLLQIHLCQYYHKNNNFNKFSQKKLIQIIKKEKNHFFLIILNNIKEVQIKKFFKISKFKSKNK